MVMTENRVKHLKVIEYEDFLNQRLRPDLQQAKNQRSELQAQLQDYLDLESNISVLKQVIALFRFERINHESCCWIAQ